MAEREAVEAAVSRFFHMCNSHCPGNVAPLVTSDVEFHTGEVLHGPEEIHAYLVKLWEGHPNLAFRVDHVLVDENTAAAEVTCKDGPKEKAEGCFLFQLRGGLIRRIRWY